MRTIKLLSAKREARSGSTLVMYVYWYCARVYSRSQDLTLPSDVGSTARQNFITRMLFTDMYWSVFISWMERRRGHTDENIYSVRLSVCPSVKGVHCDKTEKNMFRFLYHTKDSLVIWEEAWLVGANPSTWNFGSTGRPATIVAISPSLNRLFIARIASAVTPSEKSSINTNRKSNTSFPMSLIWSSYVAPKPRKGGTKPQNCRFPFKIALHLKEVCYKVSLCENCQRKSCKAFIGLTIRVKMIGEGRPLLPKILGQGGRVGEKSPIFDLCSSVTPQP